MKDYTICYKERLFIEEEWPAEYKWDIFISAFNSSERVQKVFEKISAGKKYWLILPEYAYSPKEYPAKDFFVVTDHEEAGGMLPFLEGVVDDITKKTVCVDITGLLRPQLMFLFKWFTSKSVSTVDVIYSEPSRYSNKEKTIFYPTRKVKLFRADAFNLFTYNQTNFDFVFMKVKTRMPAIVR